MLKVKAYCAYLVVGVEKPRLGDDGDIAAIQFTKFVKGDPDAISKIAKSYLYHQKLGAGFKEKLAASDKDVVKKARAHFAAWAAAELKSQGLTTVTLYPLPNSNVTTEFEGSYPTLEIANGIAEAFGEGASVDGGLRWMEAKVPAHKGGPRDEDRFREQMLFNGFGFGESDDGVLVDDMLSFGTTMRAARDILSEAGIGVTRGIVCGHRFDHQIAKPFDVPVNDLDETAT